MNKSLSILICFLFFTLISFAQKEGEILFKETMKIEIEVPEDSPISKEELMKMMPGEQVTKRVLYFNEGATLYTSISKSSEDDEINHSSATDDGEVRINIKMVGASSENKTFLDLDKEEMIQKRDFMGKTFLVQDKDPKLPWKLGAETKEILGKNCRKATAEIDDRKVEAWFTTDLALASGPDSYYGLPGMILEVKSISERGERHIIATEINAKELEEGLLVAPKKGKKVNSEEFKKIVEEKTKEMQMQMGGGGIKIIRG